MSKSTRDDSLKAELRNDRKKRGTWNNQVEFLLSCLGYCVGYGNIWRFPYLAYDNGGGAFLIPYLIILAVCGIPLLFIELAFGQFSGYGCITAFRASPIFKGIGYGMVWVSYLVMIYYNVLLAYSLYFLFASFTSVLPWTICDEWWNKNATCEIQDCVKSELNSTAIPFNHSTVMPATTWSTTSNSTSATLRRIGPSEEYWKYRVLQVDKSTGIGDPGAILWELCLCLLLAWLIVFFCLIKGVKSTGKVVYFTATFPYVILIILLIRGCTLTGAIDGILFYITPKWELLAEPNVWIAAANQIFYSLGIGFGGVLTYASYNKFDVNVHRNTLIIALGNCATSIFAGFVIFSVIGHMAHKLCLKVEEVADSGPGLAFVVYPEAVSLLPLPQLWSILFFFMLITLGLDSSFALIETVVTALIDEFPKHLRDRKILVTAVTCASCFLMGLIVVTEGGFYWFNLFNWYSAYYGFLLLALVICLSVNYGYGMFFTYRWRFAKDVKLMTGFEPNWYFKINWYFTIPVLLLFIIGYSAHNYTPISLFGQVYPKWADDLGLLMSASVIVIVPLYAIFRVCLVLYKKENLKSLWQPTDEWGPQDGSLPYDPIHGLTTTAQFNMAHDVTYSQKVTDDVADVYPNLE